MPSDDLEYYRARAAEERSLAKMADQESAARVHLELADKYEALAQQTEQHPPLQTGWDEVSVASS